MSMILTVSVSVSVFLSLSIFNDVYVSILPCPLCLCQPPFEHHDLTEINVLKHQMRNKMKIDRKDKSELKRLRETLPSATEEEPSSVLSSITAEDELRRPSIARERAESGEVKHGSMKIINDYGSWQSRGWCRVEAMARLLSKQSGPTILIRSSEAALELMSPYDSWSNQPGRVGLC